MNAVVDHPPEPVNGTDTRVVVRCWKAYPHDVIALLPDNPGNEDTCKAFSIKDRFTAVDYRATLRRTSAAELLNQDAIDLLRELVREGFNPKVVIAPRPRREAGALVAA